MVSHVLISSGLTHIASALGIRVTWNVFISTATIQTVEGKGKVVPVPN